MRIALVLTILFLCLLSLPAFATKCQCKQHPADAEANGTCSRTEDEIRCTLTFTATPPDEYQAFVNRLQSLGLTHDPHQVLKEADEAPPEKLPNTFVAEDLPIVFAISQRDEHFQPRTADVVKVIRSYSSKIDRVFRNPAFRHEVSKEKSFTFEIIMSYGCVELREDKFSTMVKTRWAQSDKFCDDFSKSRQGF